MDDRGPFPRSGVRRVPRDSEPRASQQDDAAKDAPRLGAEARALHEALLQDPPAAGDALKQLAGSVARALPLPITDRDALARVLGVPKSLTLRWIQDTVMILRDPAPLLVSREGVILLATRLDLIAWAWDDVPDSWPTPHEDQITRAWASELAEPLTEFENEGRD